MSIMVAMGKGATLGVLFRNAEAIEVLRKVDTLVVDKTGTLTEGKPELSTVMARGIDERRLLTLAAALEKASEHPLADAIVRGAEARGADSVPTENFESVTGKGVRGRIQGAEVAVGNRALMDDLRVELGDLSKEAEALRAEGQGVMFVAVDGRAAGLLGVADPVKATSLEAIRDLHQAGVRVVMLTGDSRTTAEAVAKKLGIDQVIAEVLLDQKVDAVKKLQAEGRTVAMAGDGINDAPALAQAEVGIAMGTGHRRGDGKRRRDAGARRPAGHRAREAPERANAREHSPEPVLRVLLQCSRRPAGRGRALSGVRLAAEPHGRRSCHESQLGIRGGQRPAAALCAGAERVKRLEG